MLWVVKGIKDLVQAGVWYTVTSAALTALAVCGLLLDGFLAGFVPKFVYGCVLAGACFRWMSAVPTHMEARGMPWSRETISLERRAVIVAGLLYLVVSAATVAVVAAAARLGQQALFAPTVVALLAATAGGAFFWGRAGIPK